MVGQERVARGAERLGQGEIAVLDPAFNLGGSYDFLRNVVMNLAVGEIARLVHFVKRAVEFLCKRVIEVNAVFRHVKIIAEIA